MKRNMRTFGGSSPWHVPPHLAGGKDPMCARSKVDDAKSMCAGDRSEKESPRHELSETESARPRWLRLCDRMLKPRWKKSKTNDRKSPETRPKQDGRKPTRAKFCKDTEEPTFPKSKTNNDLAMRTRLCNGRLKPEGTISMTGGTEPCRNIPHSKTEDSACVELCENGENPSALAKNTKRVRPMHERLRTDDKLSKLDPCKTKITGPG